MRKNMLRLWLQVMGACFLAAMLSSPLWAAEPPRPGAINYIEGQATAGGQTLTEKSVGSVTLTAGETLSTQKGRAEVLLTPGIFLRVDNHSSIQMVSPGLADTVVQLQSGRALVEVAEIQRENNVRVDIGNASTQVLKAGLYDFDANQGLVQVFDGKATVQDDDGHVVVHGGHELRLNAANQKLKAVRFDKTVSEDDFYRWARLRSSYLAEANFDEARRYVVNGGWGPGWYGAGWYWDPGFDAYTFIPGYGSFFGPFGYGFYSPFVAYGGPYFGYGGYYGGYYRHFGQGYRPPVFAHGGFGGHAFSGGGRSGGFDAGPGGGFGGRTGGFGRSGGFGGRR
jgi:FecR protein